MSERTNGSTVQQAVETATGDPDFPTGMSRPREQPGDPLNGQDGSAFIVTSVSTVLPASPAWATEVEEIEGGLSWGHAVEVKTSSKIGDGEFTTIRLNALQSAQLVADGIGGPVAVQTVGVALMLDDMELSIAQGRDLARGITELIEAVDPSTRDTEAGDGSTPEVVIRLLSLLDSADSCDGAKLTAETGTAQQFSSDELAELRLLLTGRSVTAAR